MRVLLIILMCSMLASSVFAKGQGRCTRKLLATGHRAEDTALFTLYLEMLLEEKVLSVSDLDPFAVELNKGKLINPIPNRTNTKFSIHHQEFEKLMAVSDLDLFSITSWSNALYEKSNAVQNQKEKSKVESTELPFLVTPDGAMFFKFDHPSLGKAFKILKPGGNNQNPDDWEKVAWSMDALRHPVNNRLMLYTDMNDELDEHKVLISEKSTPRIACRNIGPDVDLPFYEDYVALIEHLGRNENELRVELSKDGFLRLKKIYPFAENEFFWTKSPAAMDRERYVMIFNGWGGLMQAATRSNRAANVICVSILK